MSLTTATRPSYLLDDHAGSFLNSVVAAPLAPLAVGPGGYGKTGPLDALGQVYRQACRCGAWPGR